MRLTLTYFLPSGVYLGEGKLWSDEDTAAEIIRLVRRLRDTGHLPGYSIKTSNIMVLISVESRDINKVIGGWQPFVLPAISDNITFG